MPTPKKPKLTIKEAKLVSKVANGVEKAKAYREVYDTQGNNNTVSVEASRTLNKPHVKQALYLALEARGITPDKIIAPVAEALEHDDLEMRLKGHDRAVKLAGLESKGEGTNVNINFNQHIQDQRERYNL